MITLAAAQTTPHRGDLDANLAQHLELAELASTQGADLLVYPELSLTGYELDLAGSLAIEPANPRLRPLTEAAGRHAMTLVVGAPVRLGRRLHVGALVLGADGTVEVYTKQRLGAFSASARVDLVDGARLPPGEASVFEAGRRDPGVMIRGRQAAIAVCADVGDPAHAARAAARGASVYVASMFVIASELERDLERLRDRAVTHRMTVVLANMGAPSGGLVAGGCSAILGPDGRTVASLPSAGAGVVAATVGQDDGWVLSV